jgi:hypothetical protein
MLSGSSVWGEWMITTKEQLRPPTAPDRQAAPAGAAFGQHNSPIIHMLSSRATAYPSYTLPHRARRAAVDKQAAMLQSCRSNNHDKPGFSLCFSFVASKQHQCSGTHAKA